MLARRQIRGRRAEMRQRMGMRRTTARSKLELQFASIELDFPLDVADNVRVTSQGIGDGPEVLYHPEEETVVYASRTWLNTGRCAECTRLDLLCAPGTKKACAGCMPRRIAAKKPAACDREFSYGIMYEFSQ